MEPDIEEGVIVTCHYCSTIIAEGENVFPVYDRNYCDECYHEHFFCCDRCGAIESTDYEQSVNSSSGETETWCNSCQSRHACECESCNSFSSINSSYQTRNGYVCSDCSLGYYTECSQCGYLVRSDSCDYNEEDDSTTCSRCVREREPVYVHDYGYRPNPFFHHGGQFKCFIGLELEVEPGRHCLGNGSKLAYSASAKENWFYQKYDGSLSSGGFEIVTHPHTYERHLERPYQTLLADLARAGYRSHNGGHCGLHFHIDREFLGEDGPGNLVYLVEKFASQIWILSRRGENEEDRHYCRQFWQDGVKTLSTCKSVSRGRGDRLDRYHMVNVTNEHTVELRFFRGTLNHTSFMSALQFVTLLAELAIKENDETITSISWEQIIGYIPEFVELTNYWNSRKPITQSRDYEQRILDLDYPSLSEVQNNTEEEI